MKTIKLKSNLFFSILVLVFSLIAAYTLVAQAVSEEDIIYPVPELGNCKDETACRAYCDKPQNLNQCLDFAEEHGLIPEDELEMARKFEAAGGEGPGGCTSQESCESFCNDISNIDVCLAFAEENDLMPPDELEEARKVQAALAAGAQLPGGCRNKDECEDYCESGDASRMEECIAFAEAAGFIPEDELEEARMVLEAMKKGAKPPPCRGREECDVYCSEPENLEACLKFAEAAGFISPEEAEMARKTGGKGPGGCRGRECEDFCEKEENMPVCIDFAIENGMMSAEEAEMARKTGGKGPGNCKGREECEAFCEDPANQEVCFNFAKEHGLISEEDMQEMAEGRQSMMEGLEMAPPEVLDCLTQALGADKIEGLRAGTAMPSREMGDAMQNCFGQMMGEMGPPGEFPGGPGGPDGMPEGFSGPGGCRTPQECMAFCQENPEECEGFGPPGGQGGPPSGEGFGPPEGFEPPGGFGPPPEFEGNVPSGIIPSPEQIQQYQEQFQEQFQGETSGEPQAPPTQEQIQQFQQQIQEQMQQQIQQQYQQQFEQQYQQEFQQQYQQLAPPEGFTPPPDGSSAPPPSYTPPPDGSYTPPPDGSYTPPPSEPPPPSSSAPQGSLLGNLLRSFLNLFR